MVAICRHCRRERADYICESHLQFNQDSGLYQHEPMPLCAKCDALVHVSGSTELFHTRIQICHVCREMKSDVFCVDERTVMCSRCDLVTHSNPANASHLRTSFPSAVRHFEATGSLPNKDSSILWLPPMDAAAAAPHPSGAAGPGQQQQQQEQQHEQQQQQSPSSSGHRRQVVRSISAPVATTWRPDQMEDRTVHAAGAIKRGSLDYPTTPRDTDPQYDPIPLPSLLFDDNDRLQENEREMRPAASGTKMAPGKRPKTAPATAGKRDDDCPKEKRRATAVAPSALPYEVKKFEDDTLQLFVNASNEPQSDYGSGGSTLLPVPEDAAFEPMINIEAGMVNQLLMHLDASPALDKGDCAHGGDWTSGDTNMDGRDDDLNVPPRIFVREDTANILHCVQTQDRWAGGITHLPDGTTTRIGTSPPQTPLSLPADTAIVQIPVGMRLVQVTYPSGEVQLVLEHEPAPPRQQTVSAPLIQRGLEPTPLLDDGAMQLLQPDEHQQARLAQIRDRRKNSAFISTMRYAQRFVRQQEALQQSHELTLERSHPNNDGEKPQK